ncbi:putative disease resistance protein RGA4 [Lolium rigidum]|uniref:putative disease resistance protein RGA4 n=1 Tax=Lolium rigidum TaxID=89674 RepID=UPI001F5D2A69|nr:putative disease resistance protein RGA4 [Lolium rigidum]
MAALGGMLAAAILKVVADQIGSAIGGQIKLQNNFEKELRKMKMALESVEAVLKVAERRSITDEPTLLWLKRLKDAMYAISDMIDEFEADTEAISKPSARKLSFKKYLAIMIPCITIFPKITMANKMEKMRDDLEVITDQHKKFKLKEGTNANEPQATDIRETSSTLETQIIGRTEEKDEILALLSGSMTEEITILPIYGIGGIGKTTMAKMIYNSTQFREYSQVWVYVSQTFDLKKIGNSIISQLSEKEKESEYTQMEMIRKSLQKLLANKKILIVLDDLWEGEEFHLERLMDMLRDGKGGIVVGIVTTRDDDIANKISTIKPYKLAPLTDDICWSIIKQKSAFESRCDKEQLEEIGKIIAMKCAGVALAAKALGYMLRSMKFGEWESMRDSDIWNVSTLKDTSSTQVLVSLKLSYSVMPSYLKLCFAYCAIFPKGHQILKDDLIHQWISLGFSTWQLGERYINQLLGLSFLEHSKSPSTIKLYDEDATLLAMHDPVHDLARLVMEDEILVVGKDGNTEGSWYHYALLDDCSKPLGLESSKIRALRFMGCDKIELHCAAFSSAKSLRVLDLSECIIHKLPDSIGVLKQLRYLNAPRVQDAVILNGIIKLSKLLYLNLHGSSKILALPESFGRLKELVHLDLSNCSCIGGVSEFLGSLIELKYLNLSYCKKIGEMRGALGALSKLEYLKLSFSSYLETCKEAEVLGTLNKLEYLNLSSHYCRLEKLPEALGRFIQLKYLNLSGCEKMLQLPRSFRSLKKLAHLDLSGCGSISYLDEALAGLSNLQHLNLQGTRIKLLPENVTKLRYLNVSGLTCMYDTMDSLINDICSNLSNLEHLDLSNNTNRIRSIPESICNLRKLHTLNLANCWYLVKIPGSIGTMDSLKFLDINGCWAISKAPQVGSSAISLPHFGVQPGDGHSSSNLVLLQHIDSVVLKLTGLENVKSVEEAQRINLMGKKKLEDLKLEWTPDAERFVDHKILMENMVPPSTLVWLEICGYSGVSFPAWLVLYQLPNLECLVLRDMVNLEEWTTSHSSGEDHVLEKLEIHDCPLLRLKPLPPKAKMWRIANSDKVLSSWGECTGPHTNATSSFSPVTTELSVENCKVPLHQWRLLQHLIGLTDLHIKSLVGLTGSPEVIQHLSSLKILTLEDRYLKELPKWLNENNWQLTKLTLRGCNSMASLPHWLGELTSLKELVLFGCAVLSSLPESLHQLGGLQALDISDCPKLNHLGERVCLLPSSLDTLKIRNCNGIKCLPEGREQLTNLQILHIHDCPDLKQWCELEENMLKLAHIENKYLR